MSDLQAVTTAGAHPTRWAWPWPASDMAVWVAVGAGHLPADSWALEIARWADTDPHVILEALGGPSLAQQPPSVLLAGAWAGLAAHASACRDDAIRAAVRDGVAVRQVARAVGMSHSGVARVIARGNDESDPARP